MPNEFYFPLAQSGGFDWEGVVPIIIFIFYALSQFLGSGSKKKAAKERKREAAQRRKQPAGESQSEAAEAARARQIREEIQRRVAERQQTPQPAGQGRLQEKNDLPRYDPTVPESSQVRRLRRAQASSSVRTDDIKKPVEVAQSPEPVAAPRRAAWADRSEGSSIEERLVQQRKRLELARSERNSALKKASEITAQANRRQNTVERFSWKVADMSPARLRGDVIEALSDPAGAQKAILYLEILGPPLAYRDPQATGSQIP